MDAKNRNLPAASNMSERTLPHVVMGSVVKTIARQQKLKEAEQAEKQPHKDGTTRSPEVSVSIPRAPSSAQSPERPSQQSPPLPKKGILKAPKVRFQEELEPATPLIAKRPPPPPPPIPPPPPEGFVFHPHLDNVDFVPVPPPPAEEASTAPPTPLNIFTEAVENDENLNAYAFKLYIQFMNELSAFVEMQGDVIGMRLRVQEKRQQLKMARERVAQNDMHLMDHLRHCMAEGLDTNDPKLVHLYEASQEARNEVGPVEVEYEPMEIQLGADEFQLSERYNAIEYRFGKFFRLNAAPSTTLSMPSTIEYEESSAPSASGEERGWEGMEPRELDPFHGLMIGGEVGVGQLPRKVEPLIPISAEEPSTSGVVPLTFASPIESPAHHRRRHSTTTPDDDTNEQLSSDLAGISGGKPEQPGHMSHERKSSDVLTGVESYSSLTDVHGQPSDDLPISPGQAEEEVLSFIDQDNLLLLLNEDSSTQSTLSDYLVSFESTHDRVNRWILHQLRVSPREIYALRRRVLCSSPGVPDWANLVLSLWAEDDAPSSQAYINRSHGGDDGSALPQLHAERPYPDVSLPSPEDHRITMPILMPTSNVAQVPTTSALHDRTISGVAVSDSLRLPIP